MFTSRISIQKTHLDLGNSTQPWQWMQMPTHFKDKKEQAKLHSVQLVNIEVSIYPFFLNREKQLHMGN